MIWKKLISIVLPCYGEEKNIYNTYTSLLDVLKTIKKYDFEIIFVNDGSPLNDWFEIAKLAAKDKIVKGVNLSRNFGKEIAITAGIELSRGDAIITLDADGQHPVEKIPDFIHAWEEWYDIVYNKRPNIKWASFIKTFSSKIFYYFFNKISDFKLEPSTTDYRLLDRKVVDVFVSFKEKNRIYRGLVDWIGFNKKALIFDALPNKEWRKASYNFFKLLKLAMDSVTSFSLLPLKIVWYMWILISIWSYLLFIFMLIDRNFGNKLHFSNIAFAVVINTLLIWIVLVSLGLIALYIANIHEEVLNRPLYIVKEKINIK
mgnify:FL=1